MLIITILIAISTLRNKVCDAIRRRSRETPMVQAEDVVGEHDEEEDAARFNGRGHWAVPLADWGDSARSLENKRFWQALNACLERLPPRLAQLFMLRELAGMETDEVGCQPTSLRQRQFPVERFQNVLVIEHGDGDPAMQKSMSRIMPDIRRHPGFLHEYFRSLIKAWPGHIQRRRPISRNSSAR